MSGLPQIVQIVPQLPPAVGGVAGFAATLARALAERHGVPSRFLVADSWPLAGDGGGLAAEAIGERDAESLARRLASCGADRLLLHYVNYGYERRGCPAWLVGGVLSWRGGGRERRLVTYFHEVYATGPPWRSSFWLFPVQRRLAARLALASDGAATSLPLYGRRLARWRPRADVAVAPVFSTLGEPAAVPPPAARSPRIMVVFGGAGNRRRAYGELREALATACRRLEVAEIVDLGPPLPGLPARVDSFPVRALGTLPEPDASAVLLRAYAGFLGYPPAYLEKSTVFAAYCAHGVVPVCAWPAGSPAGAVAARPPCWNAGEEPAPADLAELAARARSWYGGHDLPGQAARLAGLLDGNGRRPA